MKCTNEADGFREDLEALLDGELDGELAGELGAARRAELERHLETCESCREELARLRKLSRLVGNAPRERAPAGLSASIMAAARAERRTAPAPRILHLRRWIGGLSAVAAAVLVGVVGLVTLRSEDHTRLPMTSTAPAMRELDRASGEVGAAVADGELPEEPSADKGRVSEESGGEALAMKAARSRGAAALPVTEPTASTRPPAPAEANELDAVAGAPAAPAPRPHGAGRARPASRPAPAAAERKLALDARPDGAKDSALARRDEEKADRALLRGLREASEKLVGERERFGRDAPAAGRVAVAPSKAKQGKAAGGGGGTRDVTTDAADAELEELVANAFGTRRKAEDFAKGAAALPAKAPAVRHVELRLTEVIGGREAETRRIEALARRLGGEARTWAPEAVVAGLRERREARRAPTVVGPILVRVPAGRAGEFIDAVRRRGGAPGILAWRDRDDRAPADAGGVARGEELAEGDAPAAHGPAAPGSAGAAEAESGVETGHVIGQETGGEKVTAWVTVEVLFPGQPSVAEVLRAARARVEAGKADAAAEPGAAEDAKASQEAAPAEETPRPVR